MFIYIACPYSKGDVGENIRNSVNAAEVLRILGHTPYNPLLMTHLWNIVYPHPIEYWYTYDLQWLERCDAVLRLPGESHGADVEVLRAKELGKPVYYSLDEIPKVT